ncbi:hypothetical protein DFH09DRAFT_1451146 [Mycena vulgaris]|nr:hypothetical protein DFH09DRAFT_1451146 [Mycena vulgaris]
MDEDAAHRHPIVGTPTDMTLPRADIPTHSHTSPRTHAHRRHDTNGGTRPKGETTKSKRTRARKEERGQNAESRKLGQSASLLTPTAHRRRRSRNTQGYRRPTQVRRISLVPIPARTPPLLCRTTGTRAPGAASATAVPVPVLRIPARADRRYVHDGTGTERTGRRRKEDSRPRRGRGKGGMDVKRKGKAEQREKVTQSASSVDTHPQYMSTAGWLQRQRAGASTGNAQVRRHPRPMGKRSRRRDACVGTRRRKGRSAIHKHGMRTCAPAPPRETPGRQHARDAQRHPGLRRAEPEQRIASSTDKRPHRRAAPDLRPANGEVRGGQCGEGRQELRRRKK